MPFMTNFSPIAAALLGLGLSTQALAQNADSVELDAIAISSTHQEERADGPVERYFRHTLLGDYFSQPFDGHHDALLLLSGSLSAQGTDQIRQRLRELAREFDSLLARDAALPAHQRTGLILVLAQKPWTLQAFAPWRRER